MVENSVKLTPEQVAQFTKEVDNLKTVFSSSMNPLVAVYIEGEFDKAKESPSETMAFILPIARELTAAITRIHNAGAIEGVSSEPEQ